MATNEQALEALRSHREGLEKRITDLENEVKTINATQPFGEHVLSLRDAMREQKDNAYTERNRVVSAFATAMIQLGHKAFIMPHNQMMQIGVNGRMLCVLKSVALVSLLGIFTTAIYQYLIN